MRMSKLAEKRKIRPISNPSPSEAGLGVVQARTTTYESRLTNNPRWALNEGSSHFEGKSAVFAALHKVAKRLDDLQIPYAVMGGMALFHHGFRRFTEDIELLVSNDDLRKLHEN